MIRLTRLKYLSRQSQPMDRAEIDEIVAASREGNARRGITGALVVTGNVFFQILEGPANAVGEVFAKIRADRRHTDVTPLAEQSQCDSRLFPGWRMEQVALERTPESAAIEEKLRELARSSVALRADLTRELSRLVAAEAARRQAA